MVNLPRSALAEAYNGPRSTGLLLDSTQAIQLSSGTLYDCRLDGILILKDAGPAAATITGFTKMPQAGAPTSGAFTLSGLSTQDVYIPCNGMLNDFGAVTVQASVAQKVMVFYREVSPQPWVFTAAPARNALPAGLRAWNTGGAQAWIKTEVGGGTVTVNGDVITCATNGATGRAFMEFGLQTILGGTQNMNRVVVISVELAEDFNGNLANGNIALTGNHTVIAGQTAATLPAGFSPAGTRIGFRFMVSAVVSMALRVGVGVNNVEGAASSPKFRKPVVEVVDATSAGPYGEGIAYASDALFDYAPNITFSNGDAGVITYDRTLKLDSFGEVLLAVGDSFGNDAGRSAGLAGDWPDQIRRYRPELCIVNRCVSGQTLTQMAASIALAFDYGDHSTNARKPKKLAVNGGVNDVFASNTLGHNPLPGMLAAVQTIADYAAGQGVAPQDTLFYGVSPCGNNASYNVAKGHDAKITSWNALLRSFCQTNGFAFAPLYEATRKGPFEQTLAPAMDVGDGLHPNFWMFQLMGRLGHEAYEAVGTARYPR